LPIVGDLLQRPTYKILQTIGEGTAGVCRLAKHDIFDRDVVQKTISLLGVPDGVAREPNLLKEARHKHLIEVWDAQWEPDPQFAGLEAVTFICAYHPGGSVYNALMDGHEFGVAGALRICGQMLDALEYLHQGLAYLHRDVKPGNVLLDQTRENAVLADLGSAGRIDPHSNTAPDYGGTPLYLAPEAKATGHVTSRSDLYSIGVVTVEMLAGRFEYESIAFADVDMRLTAGKRSLDDRRYTLPPWVPPNVRRFVGSLIRVDPTKRPDTARAALRKLNGLRYVDWRRTAGTELLGEWVGTWPPDKLASKRRSYRVQGVEVPRGAHAGKVRLVAQSRTVAGQWRAIRSLDCYTDRGDGKALAEFFRQVEAVAQAAPA
jgi:serine/threonine protein kinase